MVICEYVSEDHLPRRDWLTQGWPDLKNPGRKPRTLTYNRTTVRDRYAQRILLLLSLGDACTSLANVYSFFMLPCPNLKTGQTLWCCCELSDCLLPCPLCPHSCCGKRSNEVCLIYVQLSTNHSKQFTVVLLVVLTPRKKLWAVISVIHSTSCNPSSDTGLSECPPFSKVNNFDWL